MEEAIESWRLVVCKREKQPREKGDERPASSPASPLAGWLHKGREPVCALVRQHHLAARGRSVHSPLLPGVRADALPPLSLGSAWTQPGLSLGWPHLPPGGHFPSYESCLSHCCPLQSSLPKWKLTNISHCAQEQVGPALFLTHYSNPPNLLLHHHPAPGLSFLLP